MSFELEKVFPEIQTPVTLLWPSRASGSAQACARWLQGSNRLSNLRIVEGTGPFAPLESPAGVIDVLGDELRGELRMLRAAG